MERKVYIRALSQLSRLNPDPDWKSMFSVMEARRLSLLMKRALSVSRQTLSQAGIEVPQAVITGTGLGCIENTEKFLRPIAGLSDEPLRPTYFMQSTHNTIGSLIAISLGCHGYNATYSHGAVSFESALLDAFLQIASGELDNALVGAFEEVTPEFAGLLAKTGWDGVTDPGDISWTAVSVLLSSSPEGALCELSDVRLSATGASAREGDPASMRLTRGGVAARYGDNFSVSALGLCDAAGLLARCACRRVEVDSEIPGKSHSTISLTSVCGK